MRFLNIPCVVALCVILSSCLSMDQTFDEGAWRKKIDETHVSDLYAPHYSDCRYFNPWMPMEEKGLLQMLKWRFTKKQTYTEEGTQHTPAFVAHGRERIQSMGDEDFIMWVGHATFLMRINGEFWLTDPIFSERALLPKRKIPPAISVEDLKSLGVKKINVIISHNHYDHLDTKSILSLPEDTRFYVPLGLKKFLTDLNRLNVVEMDWWQTETCGNSINVACLPMQHWSRRIGQSINSTLWASFMITTPDLTIYFAGDSGYFIGYREIGRKFPGIDYVLMPATAYHPRWFMHYAHVNMEEALDAFHDLKAKYFIPTQWGTFHLGDEPVGYAALELKRKIRERNLDASRFIIMDIGQIIPTKKKTK